MEGGGFFSISSYVGVRAARWQEQEPEISHFLFLRQGFSLQQLVPVCVDNTKTLSTLNC